MNEAAARSRLYGLLARCAREGPTDRVREAIDGLPALLAAWPEGDADARAALHQEVFGRQVFPYESVIRGADGLRGGPFQEAVTRSYAASGLPPWPSDLEPDHLVVELMNLSWLCAAESDALACDRPDEASRVAAVAAAFVRDHLLRWLRPVADALAPWPWHADVVEMAIELARSHVDAPPWEAPAPPTPRPGPRDHPRRFAEWMVVPANAGFVLTHHAIDRLAAEHGLPRGFGSRVDTLETLLRTAHREGISLFEDG